MANARTVARIESRIKQRAAELLQFEISDPRASFITVTRVEMKSDLLSGKIFYSVLGSESERSKARHMRDHAAGFLQRQIAPVLDLRRMPRLSWEYDESIERAANMDQLIRDARDRDASIRPEDQPSEEASEDDA